VSIPLLIVAGVIASAFTKLNAVILGRPVQVPVLMLAGVVLVLALLLGLAAIVRVTLRDWSRRPQPVYVITTAH
jgi:hypothetical protein